jgi:four helix bundle protein
MRPILSYRDLHAWQSAMELLLSMYDLIARLPRSERFELASQMRRAAVSVPSNIAEGQASGPGGRYRHHVRIALGSLAELDTQVEAAKRIGYFTDQMLQQPLELLGQTFRLVHGLDRSLKRRQVAATCLPLGAFLGLGIALLFS